MTKSRILLVACALVIMNACNSQTGAKRDNGSTRSLNPGSHAFPTNDQSAYYFHESPDYRRQTMRVLLISLHHPCGEVEEALFEGGLDGTDLWRVRCKDSGEWLVTFIRDRPTTADSCSEAPAQCQDAWRSVEAQ